MGGKGAVVSMGWLVDPETRQPLPAITGKPRRRDASRANHWRMERDESGAVVRMSFRFCDDPECCQPFAVPLR